MIILTLNCSTDKPSMDITIQDKAVCESVRALYYEKDSSFYQNGTHVSCREIDLIKDFTK